MSKSKAGYSSEKQEGLVGLLTLTPLGPVSPGSPGAPWIHEKTKDNKHHETHGPKKAVHSTFQSPTLLCWHCQ